MPRQKLKITFENGEEFEVKVTPKVEVAVEKYFKVGMQSMGSDAHAEHLYYMAYVALHHTGKENRSFEDFMNDLEDVDVVGQTPEDADASDPSMTGPPGISSS